MGGSPGLTPQGSQDQRLKGNGVALGMKALPVLQRLTMSSGFRAAIVAPFGQSLAMHDDGRTAIRR
jgi:hypothetical protein